MELKLVSLELLRQARRVRHAEQRVRRDKLATARASHRFKTEVLASPTGLAVCSAAGFAFDRLRQGEGVVQQPGIPGSINLALSLVSWMSRVL